MIAGLMYGLGCGALLVLAVIIGLALDRMFGPGTPPITGGRVIGERLSDRSATYWHAREAQRRMDELASIGKLRR